MDNIELRRFAAEDRDWLVEQHAVHYARDEGFDDSFGELVARILDDFLAQSDPGRERGWIAQAGAQRLGSIFCVRLDAETAKLRLFLLTPEARGQGLGRRLLETCMGFAREAGYRRMVLWTHESHRAAGALYARNGWTLESTAPVVSFGQPNVEQHWSIGL
ncbi:TDP-fucosamine acetyltransferase [Sulfitobacter sp. THAF37]|uniref:GNAT family N-acetyltransferase n=1 Tax=Sulfitobacter sp. THAF37 TaxID=2587855 RepID=UPI001267DAD0|nr:GNAT family N-acetyltransferase [Sulfitobacter sp. THAF37]QFT59281.1 TDP-fucosamine acetyltransferase [Sulfitobacter sp. THAF37]